ncbi:MAG: Kelch repeat-containing protein, partial [Nitrospirales bacterium]
MLAFVACLRFLPWPGSAWGASQPRTVFGEERFDRVGTDPDLYQRTFSIPVYVGGPYTLHIVNGNPDGSQRVAIEDAVSSGSVVVDGVEVVSPQEFSQTVATIDKTLSLTAGPHSLEVTFASAPNSYIRLTIAGVITLADLAQTRSGHTANLLGDGTALLAGGRNATGVLDTAEVFDPATLQSTLLAATLTTPRAEHTSSLIPGTDALLIAGEDALGQLFSTERFRVSTGAFAALSPTVSPPRAGHSSTALLDGRVLILGGRSAGALDEAEFFDAHPAVVFTPAYDPEAGTFTALPNNLLTPRWDHQATLLVDGRILITGGRDATGVLNATELFDPVTEQFTALAATMTTPRAGHAAMLQPDGRVLLLGGENSTGYLNTAE